MFTSAGQLYFVDSAAGTLYRMAFSGGVPTGTGHITTSVADLGVTTGTIAGLTATSGIAGSEGVGWSVVVSPS